MTLCNMKYNNKDVPDNNNKHGNVLTITNQHGNVLPEFDQHGNVLHGSKHGNVLN